ncbi:acyl-CoA dehydrogenase family protein [Pseudomonas sp. GD03860]|uniref:acyl-CoA dehydrogenase family protein n=1 Tax=Pseudomonas TaxID=286 RepID=UPI00236327CF|nr:MULTISPECIES: acyl-CoA dehydrogenase family protein [Pseudomonas]MDD2058372.1 acyl-CoA dehydrogenase family protein [Pseudomonas putida]MDH0636302.1 acyl-CoA dehydrogenase family protein [Pseudomonas sp. GD03860]
MQNRLIFDQDHELFREQVRKFVQKEVAPHVEQWRKQGRVDREIFRKAGDQGLLLMWAEERYGGSGLTDLRYEQILYEEVIRYGDIGVFFTLHSRIVAPYLQRFGTDAQREQYLPGCTRGETILAVAMTEPDAGSDLAGMKARAEDRGDHWLLNGSKLYISNGLNADLIVVAARTQPENKYGIGLFLVEADWPGVSRTPLEKMGLDAQDTVILFFDNVRIPKANVLGDATKGFAYLAEGLAEERLLGACQSLAHAQVAFDLTLEYVMARKAFGKPIGSFQNSRFKLAELRSQLDCQQTWVDQLVLQMNAGTLSAEAAASAKLLTSELEGRVMDECVQLHGSAGYMDEYRISRMYRDARISRIFAGTSEIMKEIIGRSLGLDDRKLK